MMIDDDYFNMIEAMALITRIPRVLYHRNYALVIINMQTLLASSSKLMDILCKKTQFFNSLFM